MTTAQALSPTSIRIDSEELRALCREAGADDVGLVEARRASLATDHDDYEAALSGAKLLISYVMRMNHGPIRSPMRSIANLEFHDTGDEVNEVGQRIVRALQERGVEAVNPAMGFPMEMSRFPGKLWVVSHKLVAVEAGLGRMGIHRNVIHPKFGNFILLGTILVRAEASTYDRPIDWNPCLECKLCVAACPVGAIASDGTFDFSACYTHNYREFMGGFTNWVESVADSKNARDYRRRVEDPESVSVWQSLSFGANYKAAYCLGVCPAGEDVIGPYQASKPAFIKQVLKPFQRKEEDLYVVPGSDAEAYAERRYPHKRLRRVGNGLRPQTIEGFLAGMPLTFQRHRAADLDAVYHFTFTGADSGEVTVVIRDKTLQIEQGHQGAPDFRLTADGKAWLDFLAGNRGLLGALLTRAIRFRGPVRFLKAFARCFPS